MSGNRKRPRKLDTRFVAALPPSVMFWDDDPKATGFGVRSYSGGGKSFFVDYRLNGRQRRITIGPFPRWSVPPRGRGRRSSAGRSTWVSIPQVKSASAGKRRPSKTWSIATSKNTCPPRPATYTASMMKGEYSRKSASALGNMPGSPTFTAAMSGTCTGRSPSSGRPVRANRILAVCSKMFSLSLVPVPGENVPWRNAVAGNPCRGIKRNHEEARERFFSKAELERIAEALAAYPGTAADCVRLIMLTGCRPAEAMRAEWSEFDKEDGCWIKPSAHTKQRKTHKIPLNPPAIELIERLRKKRKGRLVFPGDIDGEPLKALWHVWHFVRDRAQLEKDEHGHEPRLYDLRHSFASVGVGGGLSLPIVGRLLGHTQSRTTQRYAHLADDPLKEAADKVGSAIVGKGSGAEIVPLRGGGAT